MDPLQDEASSQADKEQQRQDRIARKKMFKSIGRHSYIGLEFGVGIGVGYLLGQWLDGVFGTAPVMMYVTMALGMGVGWLDLYLIVRNTDLDKMDDL